MFLRSNRSPSELYFNCETVQEALDTAVLAQPSCTENFPGIGGQPPDDTMQLTSQYKCPAMYLKDGLQGALPSSVHGDIALQTLQKPILHNGCQVINHAVHLLNQQAGSAWSAYWQQQPTSPNNHSPIFEHPSKIIT